MTTVICDRCGEEIRYDIPERYKIGVSVDRGCCAGVLEKFDLCLPCREALVIWIRGDLEPKWTSSTSTRRPEDDQV